MEHRSEEQKELYRKCFKLGEGEYGEGDELVGVRAWDNKFSNSPKRLLLTDTKTTRTGVVILTYEPKDPR